MREINLQSAIRIALSAHGIVIRLNTGTYYQGRVVANPFTGEKTLHDIRPVKCGVTGLSDLIFLGNNGSVHFIECKTEKGRITPEQVRFIKLMNDRGIRSGIARSVAEALEIVGEDKPVAKVTGDRSCGVMYSQKYQRPYLVDNTTNCAPPDNWCGEEPIGEDK